MGESMENMKDIKRNQDSVFRKMSNEIDDFDSEVKSTYDKYGVEGFADKINAWRNQRVKIAVTTPSTSCLTEDSPHVYSVQNWWGI